MNDLVVDKTEWLGRVGESSRVDLVIARVESSLVTRIHYEMRMTRQTQIGQ